MEPKAKPPRDFLIWLVFGGCLLLWGLWGIGLGDLLRRNIFGQADLAAAGQFGDLFGGINALFTALAFAAVWWTGRMQREELALQRDELRQQREELAETRGVISRQLFETTLFNQMDLFRSVVQAMRRKEQFGEAAIRWISRDCQEILDMGGYEGLSIQDGDAFEAYLNVEYRDKLYKEFEGILGPFFRTLYHLFKLIHLEPTLTGSEKVARANLVRAQLSEDALILIATNAASSLGGEFRPLIERYGVLKHIPRGPWMVRLRRRLKEEAFLSAAERRGLAGARG